MSIVDLEGNPPNTNPTAGGFPAIDHPDFKNLGGGGLWTAAIQTVDDVPLRAVTVVVNDGVRAQGSIALSTGASPGRIEGQIILLGRGLLGRRATSPMWP
jgi:hypothetical protein